MMKHAQLQMISMLQAMDTDDGLQQGSITTITKRFNMAHSTVYRLWEHMAHMHATGIIIFLELNSWGNILGGHLFIQQSLFKRVATKEETYTVKTCSIRVSKTTVHHWIVASTIHVHCSSLKPILT